MELSKLNKLWIGLIIGILFPMFWFSLYWLFFQRHVQIEETEIKYLMSAELMMNVSKICVATNLLLFKLSLNRKKDPIAKGIITSIVIYALLLAYITFFKIY